MTWNSLLVIRTLKVSSCFFSGWEAMVPMLTALPPPHEATCPTGLTSPHTYTQLHSYSLTEQMVLIITFIHLCSWVKVNTWLKYSLVPRPSPKRGKRVWCSERQFLSHGAGPYFVKNVIIAFLYPELEFLTPQSIWTTKQPGLQKLGTAENGLRDKFSL